MLWFFKFTFFDYFLKNSCSLCTLHVTKSSSLHITVDDTVFVPNWPDIIISIVLTLCLSLNLRFWYFYFSNNDKNFQRRSVNTKSFVLLIIFLSRVFTSFAKFWLSWMNSALAAPSMMHCPRSLILIGLLLSFYGNSTIHRVNTLLISKHSYDIHTYFSDNNRNF